MRLRPGAEITSSSHEELPDAAPREPVLSAVELADSWRASHVLLQALPAAIYTTDAEGCITSFNEAAAEFWGRRPEIGTSPWRGPWRLYWPDGRPMPYDECPMATALREGRAVVGAEAALERPDGRRVPFLAYPTPLRDDTGALIGAVNMLVDITDRRHAEEIGQRLAAIVESSADAIASKDLNGVVTSWNKGAERLFGYTAEEMIGQSITILIPADRPDEEPGILTRIRRGERVDHYETVRQRKDGSLVPISLAVSPIKNGRGRVVGASKIARDITEWRRAQEQERLLIHEMSHRAKNAFALAAAVVSLSANGASTPAELADAARGRLAALLHAQELTLRRPADDDVPASRPTTLLELVRAITAPFLDQKLGEGDRIAARGPDVAIGGKVATSFALLLHELATNAAKYGALSVPTGRVEIGWRTDEGILHLTWEERGGPPVGQAPSSEGFGTLLARSAVKGQLGGEMVHDWAPGGVTIRLTVPLTRLGPS